MDGWIEHTIAIIMKMIIIIIIKEMTMMLNADNVSENN